MTDFSPPLALRAFEYWIFQYRRTWRGSAVSTVLFPVLFLASMGLGLGTLVDSSASGGVEGHSYLVFLAPGLLAATRRPGWLLGLALAGGGTVLHAGALVLAPLSVVQPVGVLAVPIAVLLSAVRTGRRPGRNVLVAVAICVGGVATFVGLAAGSAVSSPPPGGATLVFVIDVVKAG